MLKRIATLIAAMILIVNCYTTGIQAAESAYTADDIIDGILDYELNKKNVTSVDKFIEDALSPVAGTTPTEWFVLALSRYSNEYDFTSYEQSLDSYIKTMQSAKATDYQRISLACLALGTEEDFVVDTVSNQSGKSGIMSYIYGLILASNDSTNDSKALKLAAEVCDFQLEDGGFALAGDISDTDVTAMAIQALAPFYENEQVRVVVDEALTRLSNLQLDDGSFQSYGVPNCESTAQVLIALNTLKIDWTTDTRFIKNGNNVLDGMLQYRLQNGSFSHTIDGKEDELANAQALLAAVSCLTPLYDFTTESYIGENTEATTVAEESAVTDKSAITGHMIKYGLIVALTILCAALVIINIVKKKSHVNIMLILLAGVIVGVILYKSDIKTPDEYGQSESESIADGITVTISIDCSKAEGYADNGMILEKTEYTVQDGDTVFDLFIDVCRDYDIQNEYEGTAGMQNVYVSGIDYLYEFDEGELSGWVYTVNGETPGTGCSNYELEDGDSVEWIYTLDQGRDIE